MDTAFARNVIVGGVVVRFVTVRAVEGADACAGRDRVRALARDDIAQLYRKSLETSFAFD